MKENDKSELKRLGADVRFDEPMSMHTTFRTGGPAEVFVNASSSMEIGAVLIYCRENNIPYMYIGNGSNILVSDEGIEGVVIALNSNMANIQVVDNLIYADAGALMSRVAAAALEARLTGFEALAGIPGTVGGAVCMNAGAYGAQIKDVLKNVTYIIPNGDIVTADAAQLEMSYRHTAFTDSDNIVTACCIQLEHGKRADIEAAMKDYMQRRRDKQPLEYASAGSTFKRPEGDFAGRLIETAGLMGYSHGKAEVSTKHAGFIINKGGASSADIMAVIRYVQAAVKEKHGVLLEPEVKFAGFGK